MSLVFENELYDMTTTAKEVLLSDEIPWMYAGEAIFEEFPYFGNRTDLVTVRYDRPCLQRRRETFDHLEALPDERRHRRSYKELQNIEPVSKRYWVREDNTYHTEQTCREVWDWLVEHEYLRPVDPEEVNRANIGQKTLAGTVKPVEPGDETPCVTVKYPMSIDAVAWELKQRDWETALRQATRADCYADFRMVLMDAGGVDVDHEVSKPFRDHGVGLATLDDDGFHIHEYPDRVHPPKSDPRFMLNERAVKDVPGHVLEDLDDNEDV